LGVLSEVLLSLLGLATFKSLLLTLPIDLLILETLYKL